MKSNSVISAGLIAVGLVIVGILLKAGIDNIAFRDREVTVRGLAEREVPADLVTWPITYSLAGNDLQTIYNKVSTNNDIIVKFLTSNGISQDEISVNPPDTYDATSNRYRSDSFSYNYSINCTVTVTTKKSAEGARAAQPPVRTAQGRHRLFQLIYQLSVHRPQRHQT